MFQFYENEHFTNLSIKLGKKIIDNFKIRNPIIPHVTLARFKGYVEKKIVNFDIESNYNIEKIEKINLYESILKPTGAEYRILQTFIFKVNSNNDK